MKWVFPIFVGLVLAAIIMSFYWAMTDVSSANRACAERGGLPLMGYNGWVCLAPGAMK